MPEVAWRLEVSRMTASRIFDELESIDSGFVHMEGKVRWFSRRMDALAFWKKVARVAGPWLYPTCAFWTLPTPCALSNMGQGNAD